MKASIHILIILICSINAWGQSTIAKLKYEQAEQAYGVQDFETTLAKLEEVENLLGNVNPKLLYLRIQAQAALIKKDKTLLGPLRQNCSFYLKAYDGNASIEDKYRDVFLISESLFQYEDNEDFLAANRHFEEQNYEQAFTHMQKAATRGYHRSFNPLGEMYDKGLGVKQDYSEAFKWYTKAGQAGIGNPTLCNLGYAYLEGKGVDRNFDMALFYFKSAMEQDIPGATLGAADTYYASQNYRPAIELYSKAADNGSERALGVLGDIYIYGKITERNELKAMEYYRKAAELGSRYAMGRIGWILIWDRKKGEHALEWFRKGAEKGDPASMFFIGVLYQKKTDFTLSKLFTSYYHCAHLEEDQELAMEWYQKAAAHGSADAMMRIAEIIESDRKRKWNSKAEKMHTVEEWRTKGIETKKRNGKNIDQKDY